MHPSNPYMPYEDSFLEIVIIHSDVKYSSIVHLTVLNVIRALFSSSLLVCLAAGEQVLMPGHVAPVFPVTIQTEFKHMQVNRVVFSPLLVCVCVCVYFGCLFYM